MNIIRYVVHVALSASNFLEWGVVAILCLELRECELVFIHSVLFSCLHSDLLKGHFAQMIRFSNLFEIYRWENLTLSLIYLLRQL